MATAAADDADPITEEDPTLEACLTYLREHHCYCYFCGVKYCDAQDLADNCPGESEDDEDDEAKPINSLHQHLRQTWYKEWEDCKLSVQNEHAEWDLRPKQLQALKKLVILL